MSYADGRTAPDGTKVPDDATVTIVNQFSYSTSTSMASSFASFCSGFALEFGLTASYGCFSASASFNMQRRQSFSSTSQRFVSTASANALLFSVSMPLGATLADGLAQDLANLPSTFSGTVEGDDPYIEFLLKYGTTYTSEIKYGGSAAEQLYTAKSLETSGKMSSTEIEATASAKFLVDVSVHSKASFNSSSDKEFMDSTTSSGLIVAGGDPTKLLGDKANFSAWFDSVHTRPAHFGMRLTQLEFLLNAHDPVKATQVAYARKAFMESCPHNENSNVPVPCSNRGTCLVPPAGTSGVPTCNCDSVQSYWGSYCQFIQCPIPPGQQVCSGQGTCNGLTGVCACNPGYSGDACQYACPSTSAGYCNGHGTCNANGGCDCDDTWTGPLCERCGTILTNNPTYPADGGLFIDHCAASHSKSCNMLPCQLWCQYKYQASSSQVTGTCTEGGDVSAAYRMEDGSICHSHRPFHKCVNVATAKCMFTIHECPIASTELNGTAISGAHSSLRQQQ